MAYFPHAAFVQLSERYEQDNREPKCRSHCRSLRTMSVPKAWTKCSLLGSIALQELPKRAGLLPKNDVHQHKPYLFFQSHVSSRQRPFAGPSLHGKFHLWKTEAMGLSEQHLPLFLKEDCQGHRANSLTYPPAVPSGWSYL